MSDLSATIASALIGGTISAATGGKFANRAVTGAMQMAMGRAGAGAYRKGGAEGQGSAATRGLGEGEVR